MGKTILVVEDRPDSRNVISLALKKTGYAVLDAGNGKKAIEMINSRNIDLVILDILLPGEDGGEILKKIRADKNNDNLKIIMLTASKATQDIIDQYKKAGANGFLLKPIQIEEIRSEVAKLLE